MTRIGLLAAAVLATLLVAGDAGDAVAKSAKLKAADRNAELDKPEYYGPQTPFDPDLANRMLAEGKQTIRGYLYHTVNDYGRGGTMLVPGGPARAAAGIEVYLYPVTPHLTEWQALFAKERGVKIKPPIVKLIEGRKRPRILTFDERLQKYRLVVKTDEYGRFTFDKMLPGKYYVTAAADVNGSYAGNEVVGHSTTYDAWGRPYGVEHTRPTTHSYSTPVFGEKFIEVKATEPVLEIEVKLKTN